ncbi:hypothetical protein MGWOODY_Hyp481 [hydrothermal vent metagenome]|uniref:Uncharacterized protein n=1 Tax=hydrothermal vent metagenome TaxID=652676 RepID=A0A161K269_9ZZZZ
MKTKAENRASIEITINMLTTRATRGTALKKLVSGTVNKTVR